MIPLPLYANKPVGILGLARSGIASAQALSASGAHCFLWDDKQQACEQLPAALASHVTPYQDWPWQELTALIVSPGIPLTHPEPHPAIMLAREHGITISSDIALLKQACPDATCIGITGTNGKSTTTALMAHLLQQAGKNVAMGGNIGTPALQLEPLGKDGFYVLELSSFQLDLLHNNERFQRAIWLNISPDHLDRHGNLDNYVAAKAKIFAGQEPGDIAIIGVDDAHSQAIARSRIDAGHRVIPISVTEPVQQGIYVKDGVLHNVLVEPVVGSNLNALEHLRGEHNHQNAAAAYACGWSLGLDHEVMLKALASFGGLAHRMQKVVQIGAIRFINDSKATNADAAARSLASFEPIYWIAGGVAKAGGIASLAPYFPRIAKAYLIGEATEDFASTLQNHVDHVRCDSLQQAVQNAYDDALAAAHEDATILLAPACASFDQFKDYEARGDAFCLAIKQLIHHAKEVAYATS